MEQGGGLELNTSHVKPKRNDHPRCVQQSESWAKKKRRIQQTTVLSLVWLLIRMGLWSRLNQTLVWRVGKLTRTILPVRHLRTNRREVKLVYNKYKPKQCDLAPVKPFEPEDRFLDFVDMLDPLAVPIWHGKEL